MIKISHRGNIYGPNKEQENKPEYIMKAINLGFDVEIDVWYDSNSFYLGHDSPDYKIDESFLLKQNLWCHAKNIIALKKMLEIGVQNCFWHQEDDCTLTSSGYIWTYPGKELNDLSICVMPDNFQNIKGCSGLCSDYIGEF
jgi:hypothetical protein